MAERLILIVDDEEPQRRILAGFLKKRGYGVETAGDADEAMKVVSSRTVDLVLTDLRMPGRTGVELVDAVRARHGDVSCLLVDAHADLRSDYGGTPLSHACTAHRLSEDGPDPVAILQRILKQHPDFLVRICRADTVFTTIDERLCLKHGMRAGPGESAYHTK